MALRAVTLALAASAALVSGENLRGSRTLVKAEDLVYCADQVKVCLADNECAQCFAQGYIPPQPTLTKGVFCSEMHTWYGNVQFPQNCDYQTENLPLSNVVFCLFDVYAELGGLKACKGQALRTPAPGATLAPTAAPTMAPTATA